MNRIDIIQEKYKHDPWKVLVCCILLNQTTNQQVRPIITSFFQKWPDSFSVSERDSKEIRDLIRPTGFQNVKSKRIIGLSQKWSSGERNLKHLPGVGKYAMEAWRIFIDGDMNFTPSDKKLRIYVDENI